MLTKPRAVASRSAKSPVEGVGGEGQGGHVSVINVWSRNDHAEEVMMRGSGLEVNACACALVQAAAGNVIAASLQGCNQQLY